MQPLPTEPAEPVYTFHITPSTPEARERIADGAENPELLRGTLAQGRDLARLLDASIDLLDGAGMLARRVQASGDFTVCEQHRDLAAVLRDWAPGKLAWPADACRR